MVQSRWKPIQLVIADSTRPVDAVQTAAIEVVLLATEIGPVHREGEEVFDRHEAGGTDASDKVGSSVDRRYQVGIDLVDREQRPRFRADGS